jgi:hypothetical protein
MQDTELVAEHLFLSVVPAFSKSTTTCKGTTISLYPARSCISVHSKASDIKHCLVRLGWANLVAQKGGIRSRCGEARPFVSQPSSDFLFSSQLNLLFDA